MKLAPSAQVRWLKAFDGMPAGDEMVGVLRNMGKRLEEMGSDLGGSQDTLAVYIKMEPDLDYWDGTSLPGAIAGLVWLNPMPAGRTIRDYPEDKKYPLGWPTRDADNTQGPHLKDLVKRQYPTSFTAVWDNLCLEMKDGKPLRIDRHPFAALGTALTSLYQKP